MWRVNISAGLFLMMANSVSSAQSVDWSKVAFLVTICPAGTSLREASGVVGPEIDLSDHVIAKAVLKKGAEFVQEQCPRTGAAGGLGNTQISLYRGDPTTLTKARFGDPDPLRVFTRINAAYAPRVARGRDFDEKALTWYEYGNDEAYEKERRAQQRAEAERVTALQKQAAEREKQAADAARSAQQKQQSEVSARSAAFVTANGVKHFVTAEDLGANPFVYQGQVVAVCAVFQEMQSATEGLFSQKSGVSQPLLVSAIPSARFTKTEARFMLAGRVVGKREVKLPLFGAVSVPHLSFVGSAPSQKQNCADYSINVK